MPGPPCAPRSSAASAVNAAGRSRIVTLADREEPAPYMEVAEVSIAHHVRSSRLHSFAGGPCGSMSAGSGLALDDREVREQQRQPRQPVVDPHRHKAVAAQEEEG